VGGFQFTQPQTGQSFLEWDFALLCRKVQAHREQNPRFNLSTEYHIIEVEVDEQNAQRMLSIPGADSYIVKDQGGPAPNFPRLPRRGASVVGARVAAVAHVLKSWLGDGGVPVSPDLAESRAKVCAVCPKNLAGDWMTFFAGPAVALLQKQLELKNGKDMKTSVDASINVCDACGCVLKLKVHVPLQHVAENMSDEVKGKLDGACWILGELK
jgi:hypothetical protein